MYKIVTSDNESLSITSTYNGFRIESSEFDKDDLSMYDDSSRMAVNLTYIRDIYTKDSPWEKAKPCFAGTKIIAKYKRNREEITIAKEKDYHILYDSSKIFREMEKGCLFENLYDAIFIGKIRGILDYPIIAVELTSPNDESTIQNSLIENNIEYKNLSKRIYMAFKEGHSYVSYCFLKNLDDLVLLKMACEHKILHYDMFSKPELIPPICFI